MTTERKSATGTYSPPIAPDQAITLLDDMGIENWNSESLSASSALRRLELLRRFQKACDGFGYADISAVFAIALVSAVLQVTKTKEHAHSEFNEICRRMGGIIEDNYADITDQ